MKLKFIPVFIFVFLLTYLSYSQNTLDFEIDYAKFNYDEESVYLELYYSFSQTSLVKKSNNSSMNISATLHVEITDLNENYLINEPYNLNSIVDTSSASYKNQDLIGVIGFKIPNGEYNIKVTVKDNFAKSEGLVYNESLNLTSFSSKEVDISDIQFCSKIIQDGADPKSLYFKNGLETIPNPKNLYGSNLPVLYYYTELYNNTLSSNYEKCKINRIIYHNNVEVNSHDENLDFSNSSIVKAGFINLTKFNTGRYTLKMNIVDTLENVLASSSKNFFVYNPTVKNENLIDDQKLGYMGSEFGILSEEECDYNIDVSKYVASRNEINLYESLKDVDSKRKFLYEFWRKRDLTPETSINEFKNEYMNRVSYANSNYGHRHKAGYKTDRGRVILLYGIPDRLDSRTNDAEMKPFEVWNYDSIEGGVVFIFGDTMGISELELLHSTKRGEFFDQDWQRKITIKGGF